MFGPIRFLTAGESHGPKLTVIVEGLPAGLPLDPDFMTHELYRRQQGFGRGSRMKMEKDRAIISAGIALKHSTGAPIALEIINYDYQNWLDRDISPMTAPRPGHADLTGALKYGHFDLRLSLERSSARETACRVAAGALCKQLLNSFGIQIGGYVIGIGSINANPALSPSADEYARRIHRALKNEFSFIDGARADLIQEQIFSCMKNKDTLGGVVELVALNVPVGLGSYVHFDRRLEAKLGAAILSIPAIKGVTFGDAFADATQTGTKVHDEIFLEDDGRLMRTTNQGAGFEGGISTGLPIVMRAAMKPISTTLQARNTVDLTIKKACQTTYERSDFCAVPRALVVCEAMMALVIANALVQKLGGDSLAEMQERFAKLPKNHLDSCKITGQSWRFNYDC